MSATADTATVTPIPAPTDVLVAFTRYADSVRALPASALADLADAYDGIRGRRRRRIAAIAQHASDLAYDLGRITIPEDADLPEGLTDEQYDAVSAGVVVGAPEHLASVHALLQLDEVLGVALVVGLAILTHDQLTARDYEDVTSWWAAAGGPLPSTFNGPDRTPGEPVDVDAEEQAPRRRKRVTPPTGATIPAPAPQVRSRRTRTINRSVPALLGFLIVALILGALVFLGLGFAHLAMGDSAGVWWVSIVACGVGATVIGAIRRHTIASR